MTKSLIVIIGIIIVVSISGCILPVIERYKSNHSVEDTIVKKVNVERQELNQHVDDTIVNKEIHTTNIQEIPNFYSIYGNVFNDINGDSIKDEVSENLKGWFVTIRYNDGSILSQMTDYDGSYSFDGLVPGSYQVCVKNNGCWASTTEDCRTISVENCDINHINFGFHKLPEDIKLERDAISFLYKASTAQLDGSSKIYYKFMKNEKLWNDWSNSPISPSAALGHNDIKVCAIDEILYKSGIYIQADCNCKSFKS